MSDSPARPVHVEVAVPLPLDRPFTYRVPAGQEDRAAAGVRVLVPFRGGTITGLIIGPADWSPPDGREARELVSFLDEEPYILPGHLEFLRAAARECLVPIGEMLRAALPRGLSRREAPPAPRTDIVFRPSATAPVPGMTAKQREVFDAVREAGEIASRDLEARVAGGAGSARRMAAKGWLAASVRERRVEPGARDLPDTTGRIVPTERQEAALSRLGDAIASGRYAGFLLHGITGSGKTEVYLRAVEQVRRAGRQSVLLVPEIALTPQLLGRVRARFGEGVAVLHSGLTPAGRTAEWRRVRSGEVFLCVGARSAVFAPFPAPGLFVVDEEHDPAYKQEDGIRYQARDLALLRARKGGAVAVLGSATPSAETVRMARTGELTLLSLPERIGAQGLPGISVVDLRARAARRGADRYFSEELERAVEETLSRGEKAMLFLNRRGYAPALSCLDCGETVVCRNCQVSMTFHRQIDSLLCHYCNAKAPPPEACPACGGHKVAQIGIGTERLAAWAAKRWPGARVDRLDSDTTRSRWGHAEILSRMQRGEVDILVGTQMIAKGHDFPDVTLVGVLMADLSLFFPDFRAAERTFQILMQVSGRAGRGDRPGKVVIQTLSPEHACIRKAAEYDFAGFMEEELAQREELGYPPFGRMLLLRLWGTALERVRETAREVAESLAPAVAALGIQLLGPAPSPIPKVKNRYHYQILLKMPPRFPVGEVFPELLHPLRDRVRKSGVRMEADVDPYSMMV